MHGSQSLVDCYLSGVPHLDTGTSQPPSTGITLGVFNCIAGFLTHRVEGPRAQDMYIEPDSSVCPGGVDWLRSAVVRSNLRRAGPCLLHSRKRCERLCRS